MLCCTILFIVVRKVIVNVQKLLNWFNIVEYNIVTETIIVKCIVYVNQFLQKNP